MKYPDNCLKGILNDTFLSDGEIVRPSLFYFDESKNLRNDGWVEQSINWEDDINAIDFTRNQKKLDDSIKFSAGIAVVLTEVINWQKKSPALKDGFSYERNPLTDNKYHGNLLLIKGTPKLTMQALASSLALHVSKIIK